jgi:hypothetical protein
MSKNHDRPAYQLHTLRHALHLLGDLRHSNADYPLWKVVVEGSDGIHSEPFVLPVLHHHCNG